LSERLLASSKYQMAACVSRTAGIRKCRAESCPTSHGGLGNILFRDWYVQNCPQSAKASKRRFRPLLFLQEVHKIQYFLGLLRWQLAQFLEHLLFDSLLYASRMRFRVFDLGCISWLAAIAPGNG
jgi:hypothetical protein